MSIRLYVGNLPKETIEREKLQEIFAEEGDSITTKVIKDRKTGKCRGFAFVTVGTDEEADRFIEKYNGQSFMESPIKIEKALPRAKDKGKEDGEEDETTETVAETEKPEGNTPKPNLAGAKKASPAPTTGSGKKRKNTQSSGSTPKVSGDSESLQPDPRWANQLAQLKERLAAQTANS